MKLKVPWYVCKKRKGRYRKGLSELFHLRTRERITVFFIYSIKLSSSVKSCITLALVQSKNSVLTNSNKDKYVILAYGKLMIGVNKNTEKFYIFYDTHRWKGVKNGIISDSFLIIDE